MVTVANRRDLPDGWYRDERYVYIGRPGVFGNPFPAKNEPGSRASSIEMYREHFYESLLIPEFSAKVHAIPADAVLVCWCKPLACHGDVIAAYINEAG